MRAPPAISVAATLAAVAASSLAACGGPSSARPGGAAAGGLDLGIAFAPQNRGAAALTPLVVPFDKAKALVDAIPEDERGDSNTASDNDGDGDPSNDPKPTAYDLDGNGSVDLVAFPQVMYGPSNGWVVHTADGGKPRRQFAVSGEWADARVAGGAAMLRFEANILANGEARFSTTLRFAKGAWEPPIKTYLASQTKVPAAQPPYKSFQTRGAATLRAAPAIDDKPNPSEAEAAAAGGEEAWDKSTTLRGNVVAAYAAGARGTVLASEGTWRYVAFDPATKPKETSLSHGMDAVAEVEDESGDRPATRLLSDAWLCGWIAAAEIDEQK